MLYWLTALSDGGDVFNLFRYITFRAGGAFMTALLFGFLFGPPLINVLRKRQGKGQPIRSDGPESHIAKTGTPHHGWLADRGGAAHRDPALGAAGQSVRLAGAVRDAGLRPDRLCR